MGGGEFKITLEREKLQKLKDENLPERPYEKNVKANFQNFYLHSKYFHVPYFMTSMISMSFFITTIDHKRIRCSSLMRKLACIVIIKCFQSKNEPVFGLTGK